MASYWPPHDCWANPPLTLSQAPQIRSKSRCHNHDMKTCIFMLLTTFHHVLLYLCTELFHVISAEEVVAQLISLHTARILLWAFQTVQHGFFSSSSPFSKLSAVPRPLSRSPHSRAVQPSGLGGVAGGSPSRSGAEIFPILHHLDSLFSSAPRGPVSWRTPTPPANIAWLEGSVFPNLCNWMTHSNTLTRTHAHTQRHRAHFSGRVSGNTLNAKIALTFKKCKLFFGGEIFVFYFNFPWFAHRELHVHRAVCSERLRNHCHMVLKGKKEWRILSNDSSIFHEATLCNVSSPTKSSAPGLKMFQPPSRDARDSVSSLLLMTNMSA